MNQEKSSQSNKQNSSPLLLGLLLASIIVVSSVLVVQYVNRDDEEAQSDDSSTTDAVIVAEEAMAEPTAPETEPGFEDSTLINDVSQESDTQTPPEDSTNTNLFTDGTYTATGSYTSPAGAETIRVSVSVANGVISEVQVDPQATNRTSQRYQDLFTSGISGEVVGRNLDEVSVGEINGSSLTGAGFNAALESIRNSART